MIASRMSIFRMYIRDDTFLNRDHFANNIVSYANLFQKKNSEKKLKRNSLKKVPNMMLAGLLTGQNVSRPVNVTSFEKLALKSLQRVRPFVSNDPKRANAELERRYVLCKTIQGSHDILRHLRMYYTTP